VCGIGPGVVSVLVGNGDGSFQAPATYGTTLSADMVAVRDVNADGKLDLAIGGGAGCDVLLGNGDGTFHAARNFAVSGGAGAVAIADLNEDKHQDLVVSSSGVSVLLHVGNTTTTTKVTSTPNPSVYGQATFTANVSSSSGVPTGTVFFYEGLTQIGSTDIVGGIGTFSNSVADVGADAITAAYQGSVKDKPSLCAVLNQTVTQATTKTSVSSSSNPGAVGKTLTYTVAVVSQYGGSTTGQVTCLDNGSPLSHLYGKPLVFQKKYN